MSYNHPRWWLTFWRSLPSSTSGEEFPWASPWFLEVIVIHCHDSWVIRFTQNSSQLCCNTVILACHHFISSSLNVKESPSCNIWIILEKIMISIMAKGSWPIIMIWFPQGLCLLLTPAVPAAGKLHHYDNSDYNFIIDFYHIIINFYRFIINLLSLIFYHLFIDCYHFIIDFYHFIIDFYHIIIDFIPPFHWFLSFFHWIWTTLSLMF